MPPRASWIGHLQLSLITIPIRMYRAVSSGSAVSLHMLHKDCHQRLQQRYMCPMHGEVDRDDIVKGYEFEKDRYVVIDEEDLEKVKLETTKAIEIEGFVNVNEVENVYLDTPYYLAPDGPVAEHRFSVFVQAMQRAGKIGLGRVVMSGHERPVIIRPKGRGLELTTLHYEHDVRRPEAYLEDIKEAPIDKEELALAELLIKNSAIGFDPGQFKDRYQEALVQVIQDKARGKKITVTREPERGETIDFLEVLKKSVEKSATRKKPAAASVRRTKARAKPTRKKQPG